MIYCNMTYLDTKKVLKGRQVDMSFGLAWLGWATNTEEIIFNALTELQEILHSEWQSSVSTKPKLVGRQPWFRCTMEQTRRQNQVGFIWKYILYDGNLPELCGIYEWPAIQQDQPNRVVYVGIARAHVVAIMNHWKAESLGTAIMVIIKKLW